ncbi:5374976d-d8d6-4a2d-91e4-43e524fbfa71 [Thermothielavioides terrestris]|uniref:5374976d-d8d6-4a2d-91e4-43e524fbfa71 n=1 Tax=Thermothielavioides terrestris TaxID=2587410 RepID=A0A3S4ANM1_9PEZI|nr:5374976d-d8d6-4a2d-91e4-43e524fbfa71 [Thermothielavioides terrestris]
MTTSHMMPIALETSLILNRLSWPGPFDHLLLQRLGIHIYLGQDNVFVDDCSFFGPHRHLSRIRIVHRNIDATSGVCRPSQCCSPVRRNLYGLAFEFSGASYLNPKGDCLYQVTAPKLLGEQGLQPGGSCDLSHQGSSNWIQVGIAAGASPFAALLAGAALLWRKRRRDRGLPFLPEKRFRLGDGDSDADASHPASIGGPVFGKAGGGHPPVKTNTQIMDDLMRAAYLADSGMNDMESASAAAPMATAARPPPRAQQQQHQQTSELFLDEKAYTALAGSLPTPGSPKKPVLRWLSGVKTPVLPHGPKMPPLPPPVSGLPPGGAGRGRVPDPPRPAYFGRETMTTETTNTSVRWFG